MSRLRRALCIATCAAALLAGCATPSTARRTTATLRAAPASVQLTRSAALVAYVQAAQQQLAERCAGGGHVASAPTLRQMVLEIELDQDGQMGPTRVLRSSGDHRTDARALAAVAGVRYLPALDAELADQRVLLHWRLAAARCETVSVRVSSQPQPAAQALRSALARGHFQRAEEIVLQAGAEPELLRVLRQAIQTGRTQPVAIATLPDASLWPIETLLAQAEGLGR